MQNNVIQQRTTLHNQFLLPTKILFHLHSSPSTPHPNLIISATVILESTCKSKIRLNLSRNKPPSNQGSFQEEELSPLPRRQPKLTSNQPLSRTPTPSLTPHKSIHQLDTIGQPTLIQPPSTPYFASKTLHHSPS